MGDIELVKKLLAKGADPNARNAKALMRGGPQPARFARGGRSPAARGDQSRSVGDRKGLLAAGADPKLKCEDGTNLLMQAFGSANVEVVKLAYELRSRRT